MVELDELRKMIIDVKDSHLLLSKGTMDRFMEKIDAIERKIETLEEVTGLVA